MLEPQIDTSNLRQGTTLDAAEPPTPEPAVEAPPAEAAEPARAPGEGSVLEQPVAAGAASLLGELAAADAARREHRHGRRQQRPVTRASAPKVGGGALAETFERAAEHAYTPEAEVFGMPSTRVPTIGEGTRPAPHAELSKGMPGQPLPQTFYGGRGTDAASQVPSAADTGQYVPLEGFGVPTTPSTTAGHTDYVTPGLEVEKRAEKMSPWWFVVAWLFPPFGGIIGYLANRKTDPQGARNLLLFTLLVLVFIFVLSVLFEMAVTVAGALAGSGS